MGSLHCIAFRAESDHYQIPLLILQGSAVGINRLLDLGVVRGNPRLHELMDLHESGGIIDGFRAVGLLCGEWNEVDGQGWVPSGVNLKGGVPRGAMDGGIVGEFRPR